MLKVAIIGEYDAKRSSHRATDEALGHSVQALGLDLRTEWVATEGLEESDGKRLLESFDAFFIAPGGPFKSMEGSLEAIRFAREIGRPLIGTCGGFQLIVIEFARHVLGLADADHAEMSPGASRLIITPLACSLAGKTFEIDLAKGSRAFRAYGRTRTTERYYCSFGLNPDYRAELEVAGLIVTGVEAGEVITRGETRIMELAAHPFFVATLFVPQVQSTPELRHPLIDAFVRTAAD